MKLIKQLIKKLDQIIELLSEEKQEREAEKKAKQQEETDRRLMEYARENRKRVPTGGIHTSREMEERPVRTDGDLVPYGLSERDKAILDEFYNGS